MYIAMLQGAEGANGLAHLVDAWSRLYSHSKTLSAAVLFLHLVPLLVSGGAAIVADRATLRVAPGGAAERESQLADLAATHAFVLAGLTLSFVSGVLLFLSDVESFLPSPYFWIKLTCVALLLANGFVMTRTEKTLRAHAGDGRLWARLRLLARLSIGLWIVTTLAGVVLKEFA